MGAENLSISEASAVAENLGRAIAILDLIFCANTKLLQEDTLKFAASHAYHLLREVERVVLVDK